jgi:hypothetical protein
MRAYFTKPKDSLGADMLAEAEIHFDANTPMAGMKLVGFQVRRSRKEDGRDPYYVTFPSRPFGTGTERKYWDFVRSVDPPEAGGKKHYWKFRDWLIKEFTAWHDGAAPAPDQPKDEIADEDTPF